MTVTLKGITWDHPRGYAPLAENAAAFTAEHPDIKVEWSRRSLRDFGVQPVEDLAERYDLLVIDHPFTGRARSLGCLLDLDPLFPSSFFDMLDVESTGASTRSYHNGGRWALPTDAACQVASYRPDLLQALGAEAPRTHSEVLALGRKARAAGKWLAMPTCQSDSACLVATMAANLGSPISAHTDYLVEPALFEEVLARLAELAELSIPASRDWNPIATYDAMSGGDDIVYVPYAFSYSNYSRPGVKTPLRFTNIAGPGADPVAGAILGGAGCAISARCANVDAAVTYLAWVHRPEHQAGAYFEHQGQPGLKSAWINPTVNAHSGNFFANTLETIEKSSLRPRFDGFIPAFEHMGDAVHEWLKHGGDAKALIADVNATYARATAVAEHLI